MKVCDFASVLVFISALVRNDSAFAQNYGGLGFNGSSQYVDFGAATNLGSATFTIETWFKWTGSGVTTSTGNGGVQAIPLIAKLVGEFDGDNRDGNYFLGIRSDGVLAADFEEGIGGTTLGLNHPIAGVTPITPTVWHHAAASYDGATWRLYLDGVLENTLFVGQPPRWDSIQHAALASALNSSGVPNGFFAGVLDEARIWNYARSSSQIASNLSRTIPSAPGLLGRWSLDETNGTVAADSSGTGATGTLFNGPVWITGYPFSSPPSVSLTDPVAGATFFTPVTLNLGASASDVDGFVAKVEFYTGANKLGQSTNSPFSFTWITPAPGYYTLSAVATDDTGLMSTSAPVNIVIQNPIVQITSPTNGAHYIAPDPVTITASASDTNGVITLVEFFDGATKLGEASSQPFALVWNSTPGEHALSAVATGGGVQNTSTAVSIVIADNVLPVAAITSPADNASVLQGPVSIVVSASDSDDSVVQVEFFANATRLGQVTNAPFSFTWANPALGNYSLTAVATDSRSGSSTSAVVHLTVTSAWVAFNDHSQGPASSSNDTFFTIPAFGASSGLLKNIANGAALPVSLSVTNSPAPEQAGAMSAPAAGTPAYNIFNAYIDWTGSVNNGIHVFPTNTIGYRFTGLDPKKVYKFVGTGIRGGTTQVTGNEYSNRWTQAELIGALSYTPAHSSNVLTSAQYPGSLSGSQATWNAGINNTAATGDVIEWDNIVPPSGGAITILLNKYNGPIPGGSAGDSLYTYDFTAMRLEEIGTNAAPLASITSPTNDSIFAPPTNITITATASSLAGISNVAFYADDALLGQVPAAPYSVVWTNPVLGSYQLTAVAMDNSGLSATSTVVNITVISNDMPFVNLISPADGTYYVAPASISISVTATDLFGIAQVEFYQNNVKLGQATNAPYTFAWNDVGSGTYQVWAVATDNLGLASTSAVVNITVTNGPPPLVSITNPIENAIFSTAPASIAINASASGQGGTVTNVAFYQDTNRLGQDTTSPYSLVWSNVPAGDYALTAVAYDKAGLIATSDVVHISVTPNTPPGVSMTNPVDGAVLIVPANVTLSASASDPGGAVTNVDFYQDTTKLGHVTTSPYSVIWSNAVAGAFTLTAIAYDNGGLTATSAPVHITVVSNSTPTVAITNPVNNAVFIGPTNIALSASASDSDGTVAEVDFFQGTNKLGTAVSSPYSITWSNVAVGTYNVTAVATDNNGGTNTSAAIHITVNPIPGTSLWIAFNDHVAGPGTSNRTTRYLIPGSGVTGPSSGLLTNIATGARLPVTVTITTNGGPLTFGSGGAVPPVGTPAYNTFNRYVDFNPVAATGASAQTAAGAIVTYTFTGLDVNKTYKFIGTHVRGGDTVSSPNTTNRFEIYALVNAVSFTSAHPAGTFTSADEPGIILSNQVVFNPAANAGSTTNGTEAVWDNIVPAAGGTFSVTCTRYTNALPAPFSATANNPPFSYAMTGIRLEELAGSATPLANITSPTNNSIFAPPTNITITATALGSAGISNVAFYVDGSPLDQRTAAPYTVILTNPPVGSHQLMVVATDNAGLSATSAVINITVATDDGPFVMLTNPTDGSSFQAPANITLSATATNQFGIAKVEFYQNDAKVGQATNSPYNFAWSHVSAGNFRLQAVATDNLGLTGTSAPINITVTNGFIPPTVAIINPVSNATVMAGSDLPITAVADDSDGFVTNVAFYADASLLGQVIASPYNFTWNNPGLGIHSLTAVATDNTGLSTTSSLVRVTVTVGFDPRQIKTVFVIAMENHDWMQACPTCNPPQLLGNPVAPYVNSLVTPGHSNAVQVSYATAYYSVARGSHPSEPNYVWAEAGTDFGVHTDNDPSLSSGNLFSTPNHLSRQLSDADIDWKDYQEDLEYCPTPTVSAAGTRPSGTNPYNGSQRYDRGVKHDPMQFFTDTQNMNVYPLAQFWTDLANNAVGRYNWITPNQNNDMHSGLSSFTYQGVQYSGDPAAIAQGDNFLSIVVPRIMASAAYQDHGVIIIWTDETESTDDTSTTEPFIVISPLAKGNAYASSVVLSHSSTLKMMDEIFGLSFQTNAIAAASIDAQGTGYNYVDGRSATVNDLSDMFTGQCPPTIVSQPAGLTNNVGTIATFNVGATACVPLTYQWYFETNMLVDQTNSVLSIVSVDPTNAGNYYVVVANGFGAVTSSSARLRLLTAADIVAYFTDYNSATTGPEAPITRANFFPLHVTNISTLALTNFATLFIDEANFFVSSALLGRLAEIQSWVSNGGKLIIHDLSAGQINPNPFILGTAGTSTVAFPTKDLDVIPPGINPVVAGPFGTINNTNLDGGFYSGVGYVAAEQLPPRVAPILSIGGDPRKVVAFSYPLGQGLIYYSTIRLDCYLGGGACTVNSITAALQNIYTPNVLTYMSESAPSCSNCPPAIVYQPLSQTVSCGSNVTFTVVVSGSEPQIYQWFFNNAALSNQTAASLTVSNIAASASGVYSVAVTNAAGWTNSLGAVLTVFDTDPPMLLCSSNRLVESAAAAGTVVSFGVSAIDNCDLSVSAACVPPSGSLFPLGTNTVSCVAADSTGNSNGCSFVVTVVDTTPPTITCPTNLTLECTGTNGPQALFTATATDACDTNVSANCAPPPGSVFALGNTLVVCSAVDATGNSNGCSFVVTVVDTTPPTMTCPTNLTPECTGANGAQALFTATAIDAGDPNVSANCAPPSGSVFTLGSTPVVCSAVDATGNSNGCSFVVTVMDTTPPAITCPADLTLECAGINGAQAFFTVMAIDAGDPNVSANCAPPSGSVFALGNTPVVCSAVDAVGNSNGCSFVVTVVVDTTPPTIACPTNLTLECTGTNGAQALFTATATDACDTNVSVNCSPPSGSFFQLGTNSVICVATDGSGNTNTCTFTITINDPIAPVLTITRQGTNLVISWPQNCTAYVIEEATSFGDSATWSAPDAPWTFSEGNVIVTIPLEGGSKFFRLKQH